MGQVSPKYMMNTSAPFGSSTGVNALNPVQPMASNPQQPLLPTGFTDPGTMSKASNPFAQAPPMSSPGGFPGGGTFDLLRYMASQKG